MLDRQKYEQILKNILRDIYTTPDLQGRLAFKGGTCLYMFYELDRFSVDLDFNVTAETLPEQTVSEIIQKYLTIDDQKVNPNAILDGLGELLNNKQKNHVKTTLIRDLLFDLKSRI
jgi:predicted nucleotidyltransferase component of viral defense system